METFFLLTHYGVGKRLTVKLGDVDLKKIYLLLLVALVIVGYLKSPKQEEREKRLTPEQLAILTKSIEDQGDWDYSGVKDDLTGKLILWAEAIDKSNLSTLTIRDHPRQGLKVFISWSLKLPSLYLKDGLPRTVSIVIDSIEGVTELPIIQADDIKDPTLTSRAIFLQREKWLLNAIEKGKELRVEIPLEGLGKETFIFPIDKFDRKRIKR